MRIEKILIRSTDGTIKSNILEFMPALPGGMLWKTFVESADGTVLRQDAEFGLLVLEGDTQDPSFRQAKKNVRTALKDLVVQIQYSDLYNTSLGPYERSLSYFGRPVPE